LPKQLEDSRNQDVDLRFLDIPPQELARQMTISEFRLFACIKKREYFRRSWARKGTTPGAILQSIEQFNKVGDEEPS
jgi:hypothetical protein